MSEAIRSNILPIGHGGRTGATRGASGAGRSGGGAYPSMAATLVAVLVLNLVGLMAVTALGYTWAVTRIQDVARADALKARGAAVRDELSGGFLRAASAMEGVASWLDVDEAEAATPLLAVLREAEPLLEWAALVDLEGEVVAASGGERIGTRLAGHAWFTDGLAGPTLVEVPSPARASARERGAHGEAPSFATIAVPVMNADGRAPAGVLVARVGTAAVAGRLAALGGSLGVDVAAVAADGRMIAASSDGRLRDPDTASVRAAQVGAAGVVTHAPGVAGGTQAVLVRGIAPDGLPALSWTLVVTMPQNAPLFSAAPSMGALATPVTVALALYVLVAVLYVRLYARPLRRLAATAADIAAGRLDLYPFESRRTAEAAELSAALGKIQMRLYAAEAARSRVTRPLLASRPALREDGDGEATAA